MKNISKASLFSFLIIGIVSLFLLFGIGGSFNQKYKSWFQFPLNYEINDNSLNNANHDYGYNLMMSAEPNSIFMTEGGDNQVFSLLYFATTERRRPDIDFFDQKGNVFPRLYGDLLNTYPDELELIRSIRDFQLFSTGRPIYLTWQRENLEKLNISYIRSIKKQIIEKSAPQRRGQINNRFKLDTLDDLKHTARNMVAKSIYDLTLRSGGNLADQDFQYLGPWYFKNFGIVFRVTPLRYAIVDVLELLNQADQNTLIAQVNNISKIQMTPNQFLFYIKQLTEEGYVKEDNGQYSMVKPYLASFEHVGMNRYWEEYNFDYLNAPNAKNWDFLTREIFASYTRLSDEVTRNQVYRLRKRISFDNDPNQINNLNQRIDAWQSRNEKLFDTIPLYNYDNPGMLYNYASRVYSKSHIEAVPFFVMIARANYRFSENYLRAIDILIKEAQQGNSKQEEYIKEAREYLSEFYKRKKIALTFTKKLSTWENDNEVKQAKIFEKSIEGIKKVSTSDLNQKKTEAGNDPQKLKELANLYKERNNIPEVIQTLSKIMELEPQVFNHYLDLYEYTKDKDFQTAINTIEMMITRYDSLNYQGGNKPPLWSLEFNLGRLYFSQADSNIRNQNFTTVKNRLNLSKSAFEKFLTAVKSQEKIENDLLQKASIAEKSITKINELLKKY